MIHLPYEFWDTFVPLLPAQKVYDVIFFPNLYFFISFFHSSEGKVKALEMYLVIFVLDVIPRKITVHEWTEKYRRLYETEWSIIC